MPSDQIRRSHDVWRGYAFLHGEDGPLIFTENTVIGEGFATEPFLCPVSGAGAAEYQMLPVGVIHKWRRDKHGLLVQGKIWDKHDRGYMNVMRPLIYRMIDTGMVGLTYSGRSDFCVFEEGSDRILKRFPVLNISMYMRGKYEEEEDFAGSPEGTSGADESGEDVPATSRAGKT